MSNMSALSFNVTGKPSIKLPKMTLGQNSTLDTSKSLFECRCHHYLHVTLWSRGQIFSILCIPYFHRQKYQQINFRH